MTGEALIDKVQIASHLFDDRCVEVMNLLTPAINRVAEDDAFCV
jgi:hypothetical protein